MVGPIQRHHAARDGTLQLHANGTFNPLCDHAAVDAGRHGVRVVRHEGRSKVNVSLVQHGLPGVGPAFRRDPLHEGRSGCILVDHLCEELLRIRTGDAIPCVNIKFTWS